MDTQRAAELRRSSSFFRYAERWIKKGFAVVPVKYGYKETRLPDWPRAATRDLDQVEAWVKNAEGIPCCGPDSNCGAVLDDFFCIDVDTIAGGHRNNGLKALAEWQAEHGAWPKTFTTLSPSEGRHFFFRRPSDLWPDNHADILPGVDLLGYQHYVALPGLVRKMPKDFTPDRPGDASRFFKDESSGCYWGKYVVLENAPIAEANESVMALIRDYLLTEKERDSRAERVRHYERLRRKEQKEQKRRTAPPANYAAPEVTEEMIEAMAVLLAKLDVCDYGRKPWLSVGMALHKAGYPVSLWDDWSVPDSRYKEGECEYLWSGFHDDREITVGTIFGMVKEKYPNYEIPAVLRGQRIFTKEELEKMAEETKAALMAEDDEPAAPDQGELPAGVAAPGQLKESKRLPGLEKYASRLLQRGASEDQTWTEIRKVNAEKCSPPLTEAELEPLNQMIQSWKHMAPSKDRIRAGLAKVSDFSLLGDTFGASQAGWARQVAALLPNACYLSDEKTWCLYDGTHWSPGPLAGAKIDAFLMDFAEILVERAKAVQDEQLRAAYLKKAQKCTTYSTMNGIGKMLQSIKATAATDFDTAEYDDLFCLANGILNLAPIKDGKAPELIPHSAEYRITRYSPIEYRPEAKAERFERFIKEICVGQRTDDTAEGYETDEKLAHTLQQWCGCTLMGGLNLSKVGIWHGPESRNGKSVLAGALSRVLGGYACWISPKSLLKSGRDKDGSAATPDIMDIYRRRCLFSSEPDIGSTFSSDLLKRLSGEDDIKARGLYERSMTEEKLYLRLNILCNRLPLCDDSSLTRSDRVIVLPFYRYFEEWERDENLSKKLGKESSGILNWCVTGLQSYFNEREIIGTLPFGSDAAPAVVKATEAYAEANDRVQRFLNECCEKIPRYKSAKAKLYARFSEWCYESGARGTWTADAFYESLGEHHVVMQKNTRPTEGGSTTVCVIGYKLIETAIFAPSVRDKLMAEDRDNTQAVATG